VNGDKLTRWAAVLAVLAVAAVAAWVSYRHAIAVVSANGEPGPVDYWYPVTIDGLIVAASLVLLDAARHGESAPPMAWVLLVAGIIVTLAANIAYGARDSLASAWWAMWPALAFIGTYELLMMLVRASARRTRAVPGVPEDVPGPYSGLNGQRQAAREHFAEDLEAGRVPSIRAIREGLKVGQPKASEVQRYLRDLAGGTRD
jgi:hypothetical protein